MNMMKAAGIASGKEVVNFLLDKIGDRQAESIKNSKVQMHPI